MATDVTYNGVKLHNVLTRQWDQEIVYDSTETDLLGQRFKLQFDGILHAQRVPITSAETYIAAGTGTNENAFTQLSAIQDLLGTPRKQLTVVIDGNTVIDIVGPGGQHQAQNADIENGPKPKNISVTPIGASAFRVSFTIEAVVGNCSNRSGDGLIINNRWRVSESMDANFFTTRTISGKLRLSRGPQVPGDPQAGHYFKPVVIPPLEGSFRRERVVFNAEEDGLTCSYEVTDRQVHQAAPWPATKMSAVHSETVNNSTFFFSEISVRLEGDPSANKQLLIERALQVAEARINFLAIVGQGKFVESMTLTDHIGELPVVELRMRVRRTDVASSKKLLMGLRAHDLGRDLKLPSLGNSAFSLIAGTDYDSQRSRVPKPYGYKAGSDLPDGERRPAVIYLLQCYLQNPCSGPYHVGPRGNTPSKKAAPKKSDDREDDTTVIETSTSLPEDIDTYSTATRENIYTMAKMSTTYERAPMLLQMPRSSSMGKNGKLLVKKHPAAAVVKLAETQSRRIVVIDFERVGAMPEVPEANSYLIASANDAKGQAYPADVRTEILAPIRSPDGRDTIHRVSQRLTYLMSADPAVVDEPLPVGVNPVTNFEDYDGTLKITSSSELSGDPPNVT
ncbi:MAG: hypothetical protein GXP26_05005 [Planctomycetes bacterium]|nr:hypothetical protein [Planctomycetota bacterium]